MNEHNNSFDIYIVASESQVNTSARTSVLGLLAGYQKMREVKATNRRNLKASSGRLEYHGQVL